MWRMCSTMIVWCPSMRPISKATHIRSYVWFVAARLVCMIARLTLSTDNIKRALTIALALRHVRDLVAHAHRLEPRFAYPAIASDAKEALEQGYRARDVKLREVSGESVYVCDNGARGRGDDGVLVGRVGLIEPLDDAPRGYGGAVDEVAYLDGGCAVGSVGNEGVGLDGSGG